MITYREHPETDIFEITIGGFLSRDEYKEVANHLEEFIEKHGKARLLADIKSFGGMEIGVFWDDLQFGLNHMQDFTRCAIITDAKWIEWFASASRLITDCEIRCFASSDRQKADQWLSEHVHAAPEGLA